MLIRIIVLIVKGLIITFSPSEEQGGFGGGEGFYVIRWLGDRRRASAGSIWVFEYVLKYVVPEERSPPIYYRWVHHMLLERSIKGYIFRVSTGEGSVIDTRVFSDIDSIDPGEMLLSLLKAYLISYRDRIRALNAYDVESFDTEATLERIDSEIRRIGVFPARAVLLETLRDHGDARELNQSVLHINWIYVMVYK